MAEYIERKALGISRCNPEVFENKAYADGWNSAIEIIESTPASDVEPVRHGYWVYDHWCEFKCSDCGEPSNSKPYKGKENFCPNCGAKMDGNEVE